MRPKLVAYCCHAWRFSCWLTTGVWPLYSPSLNWESPGLIEKLSADIVYIRLHGLPGQPFLYGDPGWNTALGEDQVRGADAALFKDSLVFLEGCFGAGMADAFIYAGAKSVIGNTESTISRPLTVGPSSKVGQRWLSNINKGMSSEDAIRAAAERSRKAASGWTFQTKSTYLEV
jgi:hypothetical protein